MRRVPIVAFALLVLAPTVLADEDPGWRAGLDASLVKQLDRDGIAVLNEPLRQVFHMKMNETKAFPGRGDDIATNL